MCRRRGGGGAGGQVEVVEGDDGEKRSRSGAQDDGAML